VEKTMPTNLAIDDRLMAEAQKLGRHRTKKDAVNAALDDYVQRRKQRKILSLFGTVDYDRNGSGITRIVFIWKTIWGVRKYVKSSGWWSVASACHEAEWRWVEAEEVRNV
jgi:hypothetical protein